MIRDNLVYDGPAEHDVIEKALTLKNSADQEATVVKSEERTSSLPVMSVLGENKNILSMKQTWCLLFFRNFSFYS